MIIRIMGTSGCGKTTLVSRLMAEAEDVGAWHDPTIRKPPLGHVLDNRTFLVGHYHGTVGGCDNLPSVLRDRSRFFGQWLPELHDNYRHVLYEGVVFGDEVVRTAMLARTVSSTIVYMTTPLDECIASIRARRIASGKTPEFNTNHTAKRYKSLQNVAQRLRSSGVNVVKLDREEAFEYITAELAK
jgi:predicted ABC-type ATPase